MVIAFVNFVNIEEMRRKRYFCLQKMRQEKTRKLSPIEKIKPYLTGTGDLSQLSKHQDLSLI